MSETERSKNDFEDAIEDILGFNFRSFKTLWHLITQPNTVFRSYAVRDRVTYTPSLRLWLGLVGVQVLLSVFWGGYGGMLVSQFESQPDVNVAALERLFGVPIATLAEPYGEAAALLHPILVGGFTAFSAFLIGAFNKSLSWVARINITFGILTAATILGLSLFLIVIFGDVYSIMTWMILPVTLAYWITFTRGAPGVLAQTGLGAIVKGGIFAVSTILLVMIGGIVMTLVSFMIALMAVG